MPTSNRKRPAEMTNEEIARRVFPKRAIQEIKAEVGEPQESPIEATDASDKPTQ